jgi:hypothetical protein
MNNNFKNLIHFVKINFIASIIIWFITRLNIYLMSKYSIELNVRISNIIIYSYIFLLIVIILKLNKLKWDVLRKASIISLFYFFINLCISLFVPKCDNYNFSSIFIRYSMFAILLNLLIITYINYHYNRKNLILFFTPIVLGMLHFYVTTFTLYFNYLVLYEKIFNALF